MSVEVRKVWQGHRNGTRIVDLSVDVQANDIFIIMATTGSSPGSLSAGDTWLGSSDGDLPVMLTASGTSSDDSTASMGIIKPTVTGNQTLRVYVNNGSWGAGAAAAVVGWNPNVGLSSDYPQQDRSGYTFQQGTSSITVSEAATLGGLVVGIFHSGATSVSTSDMVQQTNSTDAQGRTQMFSQKITAADIPTTNYLISDIGTNLKAGQFLSLRPRPNTGSGVIWFLSTTGWGDKLREIKEGSKWKPKRGIYQPEPGLVYI